jgi:hypothetical protein
MRTSHNNKVHDHDLMRTALGVGLGSIFSMGTTVKNPFFFFLKKMINKTQNNNQQVHRHLTSTSSSTQTIDAQKKSCSEDLLIINTVL